MMFIFTCSVDIKQCFMSCAFFEKEIVYMLVVLALIDVSFDARVKQDLIYLK